MPADQMKSLKVAILIVAFLWAMLAITVQVLTYNETRRVDARFERLEAQIEGIKRSIDRQK